MGVVYGDIGTSPLYVMKAIIAGNGGLSRISEDFVIGSVSLIFWTLTLLTSVKYVMIALNADNHGEGGIFSLYSLVRHNHKWLIIPAIIGGGALLADGVLTPAVTVTTAIEGLRDIPIFTHYFGHSQEVIIIITLSILLFLFALQQFGTDIVGRVFGPAMLLWFTFLGLTGLINLVTDWSVLRALNPYYAIKVLFMSENKLGLFILGNVFLATTGAEALYSDLGHVGKKNIHFSWPYVKLCLVLNYLGQTAWIIQHKSQASFNQMDEINPFFMQLPPSWILMGVIFATMAAIIASQALISGSFTLVSEAIKLKLLPRLQILYPGSSIGQMYIPTINILLWMACSFIVLTFKTSSHMEAAYGLSITITMLMTTLLLSSYIRINLKKHLLGIIITGFFATLELMFFLSSAAKFFKGGYVAIAIALVIISIMLIWLFANKIKQEMLKQVHLKAYLPKLLALQADDSIPYTQTNLVYLVSSMKDDWIEEHYIYSILDKKPKRAQVYWFINVEVTDEPYTQTYTVDTMGTDSVVLVKLFLGFRMPQTVNLYLRQIIHELIDSGRIKAQPQKYSITNDRQVGDFQFVFVDEKLSNISKISRVKRFIMDSKIFIKHLATSVESWFGLEYSEVLHEMVPLQYGEILESKLVEKKK
ncbi:KUP/HAK/KT family potassium transporter [Vaginisenegalia massiliensis]|uniref:KUP/HAK/KT family potassium transporter n=1 Tax=Vaginisenegalia massiliensis TaxID=2058294 RepID=UPI000F52D98F|nr:KUP/HAK/KT family potassium transporter [Vaginisenegalia massiliensis]